MTYENKAFPHTSGTAYNHYGKRGLEDGVVSGGALPAVGGAHQAVVYITPDDFDGGTSFDTRLILPKGAFITATFVEVTEAFNMGGTTPVINVGANGSEATNYACQITDANASAEATYEYSPAGTFAGASLAADTAIGVALGGTSPTAGTTGAIKVVINYEKY